MPPISEDWRETIIFFIKVMSELDIAERRIPQDGRFRIRYNFRVSSKRRSTSCTFSRCHTTKTALSSWRSRVTCTLQVHAGQEFGTSGFTRPWQFAHRKNDHVDTRLSHRHLSMPL